MWNDSEEYELHGEKVRRVFETPRKSWWDPETMAWNTQSGTSDLEWCARVIQGNYLRRAGWGAYVDSLPDQRYPFIVDTNIFTWHINPDGQRYPAQIPTRTEPPPLGISVTEEIKAGEQVGG